MQTNFRLSDEDFHYIYSKVPRLNVDLIIRKDDGVVLIKRSIEPCIGCFHVPGGTVYKGETFKEAAIRVAKNETGLDTEFIGILGAMEFPIEKRGDIIVHTVSVAIELTATGGELRKDNNAKEIGVYTSFPEPRIEGHYTFLRDKNILK